MRVEKPHGVLPLVAVAAAHILQRNRLGGFRRGLKFCLTFPRQNGSRVRPVPVGGSISFTIHNTIIFDLSERPRLVRHLHFDFASDHDFVDVASQMWPEDRERSHYCREVYL